MSYIERTIESMRGKKLIFWGIGRRFFPFVKEYCFEKKLLPTPDYVCDSTRIIHEKEVLSIPVIPFSEVTKMNPRETVIIMTAGLSDLQSQVISNQLYYFPIYHCRSFETHFFMKRRGCEFESVLELFEDEKSKDAYRSIFDCFANGSYWRQCLFEESPYFDNNIIGRLTARDCLAFAGAFNGKHIDRAMNSCPDVKVCAFEPNHQWFKYLTDRFRDKKNVTIYQNVLWDAKERIGFNEDTSNRGMDAKVSSLTNQQADSFLEAVPLDSIDECKNVSLIALDVEGAECKAIAGAKQLIRARKPRLAICLYHSLDDFLDIPILVRQLADYRLYVKQHSCVTAIESVLYAI